MPVGVGTSDGRYDRVISENPPSHVGPSWRIGSGGRSACERRTDAEYGALAPLS